MDIPRLPRRIRGAVERDVPVVGQPGGGDRDRIGHPVLTVKGEVGPERGANKTNPGDLHRLVLHDMDPGVVLLFPAQQVADAQHVMAVEFMAQMYLGILGGLLVFLLQLTLLKMLSFNPLIGWGMFFFAMLNAFFCGLAVPFFYLLHKWFKSLFSHSSYEPNNWGNNNRQIVRGKNY